MLVCKAPGTQPDVTGSMSLTSVVACHVRLGKTSGFDFDVYGLLVNPLGV